MMGLHSAQSQALPDLNLANLPFKIGVKAVFFFFVFSLFFRMLVCAVCDFTIDLRLTTQASRISLALFPAGASSKKTLNQLQPSGEAH